MVNYPNFRLDGSDDFDESKVRTRTPVGWEGMCLFAGDCLFAINAKLLLLTISLLTSLI